MNDTVKAECPYCSFNGPHHLYKAITHVIVLNSCSTHDGQSPTADSDVYICGNSLCGKPFNVKK
ncbi:hypothetical protein [Desulfovibrio gilichinskyi]|uniref:Uncharacterized protein n=1 Tax=Desulfovibrio gilichinskyi TaxID=1519643 RepID=A0A1X7CRK7_9BACT|nr:hypothetical protein [Desulfovibrio gilichinskyi]SMF01704.1 hypothetical protein SAMN06295933_1153 [Desulfovibrio gilichinskyi]